MPVLVGGQRRGGQGLAVLGREELALHLVESLDVADFHRQGLLAGEAHGKEGEAVAGEEVGGRFAASALGHGEINFDGQEHALCNGFRCAAQINGTFGGRTKQRPNIFQNAIVWLFKI